MRKILCILITTIMFFASIRPIVIAQNTQTTTLTPSSDVTIVDGDSSNYGSSSTLSCENNGDSKSFLIKFDLGVIPSNAEVHSATLVLTQSFASGVDVSINAYKVISSWNETSVSGTNKPDFDSGVTYGVLSVDGSSGQKTFAQNFSDLVEFWLSSSSSNFGLYFEATSSATYSHEFGSRESASKPTLTIVYAPPDSQGPVISDIAVSGITSSSAKVTWKTEEEATSFVDYGETVSYGKVFGSEGLSTSHTVTITGLAFDTTYHFRVRSKDMSDNESSSSDQTFQTLQDGDEELEKQEDTVSEEIDPPSNLKVMSEKEDDKHYAELTWEHSSNTDIDGYRIYRSEEDKTSYIFLSEIGSDKMYYKDEEVEVGKTYYYVVRAVRDGEESKDSNEEVVTIYANDLEARLHSASFWKGFLICNLVVGPILLLWYFFYKKRSKNLRLPKGKRKKKR